MGPGTTFAYYPSICFFLLLTSVILSAAIRDLFGEMKSALLANIDAEFAKVDSSEAVPEPSRTQRNAAVAVGKGGAAAPSVADIGIFPFLFRAALNLLS